jgi:hypothetical protein
LTDRYLKASTHILAVFCCKPGKDTELSHVGTSVLHLKWCGEMSGTAARRYCQPCSYFSVSLVHWAPLSTTGTFRQLYFFYFMFWKHSLHVFRVIKSTILWIQPRRWLRGSRRWWTTISWQLSVNLSLILYIQLGFKLSRVLDQALSLCLYLWKPSREVRLCPLIFPFFEGHLNNHAPPPPSLSSH